MHIEESHVINAAKQFGSGKACVEKLKGGLINNSYKVSFGDGKIIFLQCINQNIFSAPSDIIHNYRKIYEHLNKSFSGMIIPEMLKTLNGESEWIDEERNFWRAIEFVTASYSPKVVEAPEKAFIAAKCFGKFTRSLARLDPGALKIIIPHFHDLKLRYSQFEEALKKGNQVRINKSTDLIKAIEQYRYLVDFYETVLSSDDFYLRIMHHDCKISNILFKEDNNEVICPIDLDTVMPGHFFSDLGDMIRTMACNMDENAPAIDHVKVVPAYYNALVNGYMEEMREVFSAEELKNIHLSGLLMTYMQAIRFLADYFMDDIYYQVDYEEQNFVRAANQLKLLNELDNFLKHQHADSLIY